MEFKIKKSLGQNFLNDKNIIKSIVNIGYIENSDVILEVGPRTGNFTELIFKKKPKQIYAIEKDYNLLAPTAFSPNEDNLNDFFIPKALPVLNLPFTMTIYDRQGKMVYQTSDANQPWNGLCTKDQVPAPDGVYIWVVQLTTESGEVELYQDQVTIAK